MNIKFFSNTTKNKYTAIIILLAFLLFSGIYSLWEAKTQEHADFLIPKSGAVGRSVVHSLFGRPGYLGQGVAGSYEEWFFEKSDLKWMESKDLSALEGSVDLDDIFRKDGCKIRIYYDESGEKVVGCKISKIEVGQGSVGQGSVLAPSH